MRKILVLPFLFLVITLVPNFLACPSTGDDGRISRKIRSTLASAIEL